MLKIEDSNYFPISKFLSGLSTKETIEFLEDHSVPYELEDYIFEYNPLPYQIV